MGSVLVREITCASALNRVRGMPFEWSLNPYVGCEHACAYCYARDYFRLMERDLSTFDREIEAKANVVDVLRRELAKRPKGAVAIGTATDPYQPIEGHRLLTRRCLEAFAAHPMPLALITKGTLVVRDADVFASLSRRADVRVVVSIGSVDPVVARTLEPAAPPPAQRLRAVRMLRDRGVKAAVICAPIVPGFSDSEASIAAVAAAAHTHGAYGFSHRILKLDPAVRGPFLELVAEVKPELLGRYVARYPGVKLDPAYASAVDARVARVRARHRFPVDDEPEGPAEDAPEQLRLAV